MNEETDNLTRERRGSPARFPDILFRYTLLGVIRWVRLTLARKRVYVAGEYLKCGRCCLNLNLSKGSTWLRTRKMFERLRAERPEYNRFHIIKESGGTDLLWFRCDCATEEGLCGDYENRPDFCRTYPDEDLYYMGGELPAHCGFRFEIVPAFDKMLKKEFARALRAEESGGGRDIKEEE